MPLYYVLIDKATGTVKGHSEIKGLYNPNPDTEKVVEHAEEWPHDGNGEIVQNRKYKFEGSIVRLKTQAEIEEDRKAK